jgi:hypothetical protein
LYEQMLELRPTTLEGYKALATGILNACWADRIECSGTADMEGLAIMISSLTGVPLEEVGLSAKCDARAVFQTRRFTPAGAGTFRAAPDY